MNQTATDWLRKGLAIKGGALVPLLPSGKNGITTLERPTGSELETLFLNTWRSCDGPELEREVCCLPPRKWRSDFLHRPSKTCIEVDGGTFSQGRHTRGDGFQRDCEKQNAHVLADYHVFRLTKAMITDPVLREIINFCVKRSRPAQGKPKRFVE